MASIPSADRPPSRPNGTGEAGVEPARDRRGRFGPGNRAARGRGNGAARQARFRALVLRTITDDDVRALVRMLLRAAIEDHDVGAARELLDRCAGKPADLDLVAQVEALEARLAPAAPQALVAVHVDLARLGQGPREVEIEAPEGGPEGAE